jgi:hypothetical protein
MSESVSMREPIDKAVLLLEGVPTQIKRAYESSVCQRIADCPMYRVGGCRRREAWSQ